MARLGLHVLWLSLVWAACIAQDEDLQFEETSPMLPTTTPAPVRRHWGIPDMDAIVGKLFVANIPPDAFSGQVQYFEAGGKPWPRWLSMTPGGQLKGVPAAADVGVSFLMVRAVGPHAHHYSKDIFALEVIKPGLDTLLPHTLDKGAYTCAAGIDPLMLTIVLKTELGSITPVRRVTMMEVIAAYYGLDAESWHLREVTSLREDPTVLSAGPGNVPASDGRNLAALSIQIGCGRDVVKKLNATWSRVASDAQDGTLAEVLQVPVVRWFTHTELPTFFRDRREIGSGDGDDAEDDDYGEGETLTTTGVGSVTAEPHPHRHHHGEEGEGTANSVDAPEAELQPSEHFYQRPASTLLYYDNIISTPPFNPERPYVNSEVPADKTITIVKTDSIPVTDSITKTVSITATPAVHIDPITAVTPSRVSSSPLDTTFALEGTTALDADKMGTGTGASVTNDMTTDLDGTPTLPAEQTSHETMSSSSAPSSTHGDDEASAGSVGWTTTQLTTEEVEPEDKNFPPVIGHRLDKVQLFGGNTLRLQLPENTFTDVEDGTTSHLSVTLTTLDGRPLPTDDWIFYNASSRQIVAVSDTNKVQTWEFLLTATDKDRDSVSDNLSVHVQQHKRVHTVNHEISLGVRVLRGAFTHAVQWQLQLLSAIAAALGDKDISNILVRSIVLGDVNTFTWTNDSLPHDICPKQQIEHILKVISYEGYPTSAFSSAVGPNMTITSVNYRPLVTCEPPRPKVLTTVAPPLAPITNFNPVFRNPVDQINATAGHLLVYRVPEDTIYDPEDGGTRHLKMRLLTMDRNIIKSKNWLQFDDKNQEFYGLPMDKDVRLTEYQLECEDRRGLSVNDAVVVYVSPRKHVPYTVEFIISLDVPYDKFQDSALLKRRFIEKIQAVFGDANPTSVVVNTIAPGATNDVTTIKWYNRSLPVEYCPEEHIYRLRRRISNENGVMSNELLSTLGPELPVVSVGMEPEGACKGGFTVHHPPSPPAHHPPPSGDSYRPLSADDYIVTFVIPIAVIGVMLSLAGLVACLLYRKRHGAKLGAGDEAERHSFRTKGIPVIFQDELEEKPEPENKPPVIMKEEKPPLPPPEYQRGGGSVVGAGDSVGGDDAPYHPPPPFPASRDSSRAGRPKPTPTYRKPPPYVPP